jgi:hypothetical protein
LYRITQGLAVDISGIDGPDSPVSYLEVEGKIYASNPLERDIQS